MDGLSTAVTGFAVVSLAIQPVDSVREIRRFLRDVCEASKELKRLIELLEQFELIFENIGALVERQQQAALQPHIDLSGSILRAMRTCEERLKLLEDVVETAKRNRNATNKATRTVGSFKLACKREDLENFRGQLQDAISLLTLAMMTNLTNLTVVHSQGICNLQEKVTATHQMTTTFSNDLRFLTKNATTGTNCGLSATAVTRVGNNNDHARVKLSKRPEIVVSSFSGLLGRLIIRKEIRQDIFKGDKDSSDINYTQKIESTWVFVPSFLSFAFNFRYLNTCGYVERTLRTYTVVPASHPVWQTCRDGDLRGVQKLLSAGQISLLCVDESGRTLLRIAAFYLRVDLFEFLLDVGLTGEGPDVFGTSCYKDIGLGSVHRRNELELDLERMYEIIMSRADKSDIKSSYLELFSNFHDMPPLHIFNRIVQQFLTEENINDYLCHPLTMAAGMLVMSYPSQHVLKPTIHHLVTLGADLHRGPKKNSTILDAILGIIEDPWESIPIGRAWLDPLEEMGIDVVEYLRTEYSLHLDNSSSVPLLYSDKNDNLGPRHLIISEKPPSVKWDWYVDPNEVTFDLLEEFKHFGPGQHLLHVDFQSPNSMHNWPYFYHAWQWLAILQPRGCLFKENIAPAQRFEKRFERRWHKKAMKLARAQGTTHRGPKIPGAWID